MSACSLAGSIDLLALARDHRRKLEKLAPRVRREVPGSMPRPSYGRTQFWRLVWTTGHFYLQGRTTSTGPKEIVRGGLRPRATSACWRHHPRARRAKRLTMTRSRPAWPQLDGRSGPFGMLKASPSSQAEATPAVRASRHLSTRTQTLTRPSTPSAPGGRRRRKRARLFVTRCSKYYTRGSRRCGRSPGWSSYHLSKTFRPPRGAVWEAVAAVSARPRRSRRATDGRRVVPLDLDFWWGGNTRGLFGKFSLKIFEQSRHV